MEKGKRWLVNVETAADDHRPEKAALLAALKARSAARRALDVDVGEFERPGPDGPSCRARNRAFL